MKWIPRSWQWWSKIPNLCLDFLNRISKSKRNQISNSDICKPEVLQHLTLSRFIHGDYWSSVFGNTFFYWTCTNEFAQVQCVITRRIFFTVIFVVIEGLDLDKQTKFMYTYKHIHTKGWKNKTSSRHRRVNFASWQAEIRNCLY